MNEEMALTISALLATADGGCSNCAHGLARFQTMIVKYEE